MAAHKAAKIGPKFTEMQLKSELLKQQHQELRGQFHSHIARPIFLKFLARYGVIGKTGARRPPPRSEEDRQLFEDAADAMNSYRHIRVQDELIRHLSARAEWSNANRAQRIALLPKRSIWLLRAFLVTEPVLWMCNWVIRALLWAARRVP